MAIFGLEVDNTLRLNRIVKKLNHKLENPNMLKNPFTGYVKIYKTDKPFLFVYLKLVWNNPIYITLMLIGGLYIAFGFRITWVHILLFPMAFGSFMFTKMFLRLALRYTLVKEGYKGRLKNMKEEDLLLNLAKWGKEK